MWVRNMNKDIYSEPRCNDLSSTIPVFARRDKANICPSLPVVTTIEKVTDYLTVRSKIDGKVMISSEQVTGNWENSKFILESGIALTEAEVLSVLRSEIFHLEWQSIYCFDIAESVKLHVMACDLIQIVGNPMKYIVQKLDASKHIVEVLDEELKHLEADLIGAKLRGDNELIEEFEIAIVDKSMKLRTSRQILATWQGSFELVEANRNDSKLYNHN
jgi:hypothetical protein